MEQNFLSSEVFSFEKPEILELKQKLIKENTILEDLNIEINYGIKTGLNEAFIINKETKNALISKDSKNKEIIKPVLRGKDVKKGSINFAELYLLYIPWNFKIEDYLSIKEYLIPFEKKLSKRPAVKTKKHEWFALSSYASNCLENFDKPKLIYPDISQGLFAVYDDEHYYINDRCFMITHSNNDINFLKALACIFSSDLLNFIFKISGALLGSSGFKLAKVHVKNLPICNLSEDNKILLANLYDEFYIANKIKNEKEIINNIKIIENQINQTLYSLYGLNEDEIKIIENNLK